MNQETKTETRTTFTDKKKAINYIVGKLYDSDATRVWYNFHSWDRETPHEVVVETIRKEEVEKSIPGSFQEWLDQNNDSIETPAVMGGRDNGK